MRWPFALYVLFTVGSLQALPLGNPAEPALFANGMLWCGGNPACCDLCDPSFSWCDAVSLRLGFYGDYVFNRGSKITQSTVQGEQGSGIDRATITTNAGILTLNLFRRIDIFTTLGETQLYAKTDNNNTPSPAFGDVHEAIYSPRFSWSVGGRAILYSACCFDLGIEGQYFRTELKQVKLINSQLTTSYFTLHKSHYEEAQGGIGLSHRFVAACSTVELIPYVGFKGSWARKVVNAETASTVENLARRWGYALGMTLTVAEAVSITGEARFGDEKAASVLAEFRF